MVSGLRDRCALFPREGIELPTPLSTRELLILQPRKKHKTLKSA